MTATSRSPAGARRLTRGQAIEASREQGFAALELFAIFTTPVAGLGPVLAHLEVHLAHQVAIEAEGTLFGAGPLGAEDGLHFDGEGLIIIRAGSLEEARQIADRDPMHRSGARTYRILPWILNEGAISFTARLSDQRVWVR
jgi:uncharacterized protein YciI